MSSVAEELEVILPRYSIHTALEAHDWFLEMMREHEEFEVETDPLMAAIGSPIGVTVPASST